MFVNFKRRVLAVALASILGVPLAACDPATACDAITFSATGADAGGKGAVRSGGKSSKSKSGTSKSKTSTVGGSHDDDCDD